MTASSRVLWAATVVAFLNPIFAASYYVASKGALDHIEPFVFTAIETAIVAPVGVVILALRWRRISAGILCGGIGVGILLAANLLLNISALGYTTATNTGFYPALIGVLAVCFSSIVLKQSISLRTGVAGFLSFAGAGFLIVSGINPSGQWVGDILALISTVVYVLYIFGMDRVTKGTNETAVLWGIQLVTVAVSSLTVSFVFGSWEKPLDLRDGDALVFLYVGIFTTLVPTLVTTFAQKYLAPLLIAFMYLLEPVWTAILAQLYLGEVVSLGVYIAGAVIVAGSVIRWIDEYQLNKGAACLDPTGLQQPEAGRFVKSQ